MMVNVCVIGCGSWGTALAILLNRNGHEVTVWEFQKDLAQRVDRTRENPDFLPGIYIPENIVITSDLEMAVADKEVVVIAIPTHVVRSVCERLAHIKIGNPIFVSGSKGIENKTLLRVSEIILQTVPSVSEDRMVVVSGPSHAEEVSREIPTVVVAACSDRGTARRVQSILMNPNFRVYTNDDVVGVELGGALKNVIAVAAGISDGVGFGDNTKAALLNRGMVEIIRLGTAMGAKPMTFAGLSGIGDLIVTCTSRHSRNRYVGEQIGKGRTLKDVLEEMVMIAEGVKTTESAIELSKKYDIDMPITTEVYNVLFKGKDPKKAVYDLMTREPKDEDWTK